MKADFLNSAIKQFAYYKMLAEQAIDQIEEEQLYWQANPETNSIAMIMNHMNGNMLSRWTDFLQSDGEKSWRNRDAEFEIVKPSKEELIVKWNEAWDCLLNTLRSLNVEDLDKTVLIRNQAHTVVEAINRQLSHYPYHVGQIVIMSKMLCKNPWNSLSIPLGSSETYNAKKFSNPESGGHFTDEFMKK